MFDPSLGLTPSGACLRQSKIVPDDFVKPDTRLLIHTDYAK